MDITGIGSIFDFGGKIIDKIFPDKNEAAKHKLRLAELDREGKLEELKIFARLDEKQLDVNAKEAEHDSIFVAGWRPAVGWVCVSTLATNYLIVPLLMWFSPMLDVPPPTRLDVGELIPILLGMLGLGGYRTYEKIKGTK